MKSIGVPKEVKVSEKRVSLTPMDCKKLIESDCQIYIEADAGIGAGYENKDYSQIGCIILPTAENLYAKSDLIVKVKEPLDSDLKYLNKKHLLFCYLHLASSPSLTKFLLEQKIKSVAFETVVVDGKTPLLAPMSAIAGRLATQIGSWYLQAPHGGNGTLLGGIHNLSKGSVLVVGAGVAGAEAARLAYGMGAAVTVLDINSSRLNALQKEMPNLTIELSNDEVILKYCKSADILVGAVYVVGKRAPIVVTKKHIQNMPEGSVVVDISIDQGGCIETSRPCSHDEPIYNVDHVIHSAITNLPAASPKTASEILSCHITPYVEKLAHNNWNDVLINAINTNEGNLCVDLR